MKHHLIYHRFSAALLLSLLILTACSDGEQMRMVAILDEADSLNRAYASLAGNDSVLAKAVGFYDRHGPPNEQMRARYLLGCAYRDCGDAPRALECYQQAIEAADTAANDCDFNRISSVYSQMAEVMHRQLLLTFEIEARRKATHFSLLAKDTFNAIYDYCMMTGAYILLNKQDSAFLVQKRSVDLYEKHGYTKEAVDASLFLMYLYSETRNQQEELRPLIDRYESFYSHGRGDCELPAQKRIFYYYKARFLESDGKTDSAETFYRRIAYPAISAVDASPMYKGLLSVFVRRHDADSIAKYAQLYCMASDSSIALKDQTVTARMSASFNYSRMQRQARENERRAHRAQIIALALSLTVLVIVSAALYYRKRQKQKVVGLMQRHASIVGEYKANLSMLHAMEEAYRSAVAVQDELRSSNEESGEKLQSLTRLAEKLKKEKEALAADNSMIRKRMETMEAGNYLLYGKRMMEQWAGTDIGKTLGRLCKSPARALTDEEKRELLSVAQKFMPGMVSDLVKSPENSSQLSVSVGILTALNFRPGDIANLLNISLQQVSNLKRDVNQRIFDDSSARTLYRNMSKRYGLSSSHDRHDRL